MPSPAPLLYDTYYHIYNRGNNRENIFVLEQNYTHFLKLYAQYIEPVADTYAYCLLRNHFHICVRIKSEDEILETLKVSQSNQTPTKQTKPAQKGVDQDQKPLGSTYASQQFSNFYNAYAKSINKAYGRTGSLFQHPFGRVVIKNDSQFWSVIAYIHQNPQRHGFVDDFRDWKWSSFSVLLSDKPTKLKRDAVMEWFGGKEGYLDLHQEWVSDAAARWFALSDFD